MITRKRLILFIVLTGLAVLLMLVYVLIGRTGGGSGEEGTDSNVVPVKVLSTYPENNSQNIGVSTDISITFSREFSNTEKSQVLVTSIPESFGEYEWSGGDSKLSYALTVPLNSSEEYTFTVQYPDGSHKFIFTTTTADNVTEEEALQIQTAADKEFGDWWKNINDSYPWYTDLPLQGENGSYFVYFDLDIKKLVATTYVPEADIDFTQEIVKQQLRSLGIDLTQYEIVWEVGS